MDLGGAIPITCAQVHSQSEHGHESKAWSLLTPLDETSRFVLLTGYSEGNSSHFKLTFNMSFQEKKKKSRQNVGTEAQMETVKLFYLMT